MKVLALAEKTSHCDEHMAVALGLRHVNLIKRAGLLQFYKSFWLDLGAFYFRVGEAISVEHVGQVVGHINCPGVTYKIERAILVELEGRETIRVWTVLCMPLGKLLFE